MFQKIIKFDILVNGDFMLHIGKYFGYIGRGAFRILGFIPGFNKCIKNKESMPIEERYNHLRVRIDDIMTNMLRVKVQVNGLENLNENEPYLITPNHQSMFDPFCLIYLVKRPMIMVAKKESKKMPIVNKVIDMVDSIYLDRENPRDALRMVKECKGHLMDGKNVLIFPEGTRSKDKEVTIHSYKPGAFKCAYGSGAKVLPVVFDETYLPFSIKRKNNKERMVKVTFLDPITPEEYEKLNTTELAQMVEDRAKEELARLRNN